MTAQPDHSSLGRGWTLYRRLLTYVIHHKAVMLAGMLGFVVFAASGPAATQWLGWTLDSISSENYEQARILVQCSARLSLSVCVALFWRLFNGLPGSAGDAQAPL